MPEFHKDQLPEDGLHVAIRWRVPSQVERDALVLTPVDVGGVLFQDDVQSIFVLLSDAPVTWLQVPDGESTLAAIIAVNVRVDDCVVGPAASNDNAVVRYDGTTGKLVQDSLATLSDSGFLTVENLHVANDISLVGTVDGVDISNLAMALASVALPDYVTLSSTPTLGNERTLTAGAGITITDDGPGGAVTVTSTGGAPVGASYVTLGANATLTSERVLTAGAGISITDGGAGGAVTITNTAPVDAPVNAEYLVATANATLTAERVLTAGANITLTPAAGTLTIAATGGGGGAPTTAQYLTLAADATLTNERVLTAGAGIGLTDAGPGGALTINQVGVGYTAIAVASYTPVLSDAGKLIGMSAGGAVTITIPTDASVAFPIGTILYFVQGAGAVVTVAPAGGVTMFSPGIASGPRSLRGVAAFAIAFKSSANVWWLSGDLADAVNNQGGTTYTLSIVDHGALVSLSNAAAITVTVPTNASAPIAIGTKFTLEQAGAGQVLVSPAGGVTLRSPGALVRTRVQYSQAVVTKVATDIWALSGDLGP